MDRFVCTKETPWIYTGCDVDVYKCPNCGLVFEMEIPQ